MLQQPRVPPTGQRQAVEVHIKWREVLDYKRELLRLLSVGTGWSVDKLDYVSGSHSQQQTNMLCAAGHAKVALPASYF
jgi:hypothetical protein